MGFWALMMTEAFEYCVPLHNEQKLEHRDTNRSPWHKKRKNFTQHDIIITGYYWLQQQSLWAQVKPSAKHHMYSFNNYWITNRLNPPPPPTTVTVERHLRHLLTWQSCASITISWRRHYYKFGTSEVFFQHTFWSAVEDYHSRTDTHLKAIYTCHYVHSEVQ